MAYRTRVANPKKKSTKKKVAKKKAKKATEVPASMRAALGRPRTRRKAAIYGAKKKTAKKATKKKAAKKAAKKVAKRSSSSSTKAPTVAQLQARLKAVKATCDSMLKALTKNKKMAPSDRLAISADLLRAVTSNSACRLASKRWGTISPSCGRRHPLPKNYKGPKGAKQLGEWSKKTKYRQAPSINNKAFWG